MLQRGFIDNSSTGYSTAIVLSPLQFHAPQQWMRWQGTSTDALPRLQACHAFADAEAGFEPNGRYALGARRDGATVEMWIVDLATDEPIGPPVRASYQVTPQDVYVPVIVY